jgi:hypothetical protein
VSEFMRRLRRMHYRELLSIDPGETTGWAFFVDGCLSSAGCGDKADLPNMRLQHAVIELPDYFPGKTHVRSIITLSVRVGWLQRLCEERGARVELAWPQTWKGSVPKKIHHKRLLAVLESDEIELLPKRPRAKNYDHNLLDAVGIGLWKLGRI